MKLTIAFALVHCVCGAERQAGFRCPDCGAEPDEVDADLERRRALLAHLLSEAHVRADDRVLVHPYVRKAPDEGDELVGRTLYERHAGSVGIGGRMLRQCAEREKCGLG